MMNDPVQNPFSPPRGNNDDHGSGNASLAPIARTGQIITFALVQGVLLMAAIFAYLSLDAGNNPPPAGAMPAAGGSLVLPGVGLVLTGGACLMAMLLPHMLRRTAAARFQASGERIDLPFRADRSLTPAVRKLAGASQTATLVGQAILEGAATINLVLMLLDYHVVYLVSAGICVIGIALLTPTTGKLRETIENAAY